MKSGLISFLLLLSLATLFVAGSAGGGRGGGAGGGRGFGFNFYRSTNCPQAESLVASFTRSKVQNDPTLAAKILRVHYHDCFVRGCDASILLDTAGSEKTARPNLSLQGFEAIDGIKAQVEKVCPGIVSCADILALAARDAVSLPFGRPLWNVPTGRKDGRVSLATDVPGNLPSPFSNFSALQQLFQKKNLNVIDLVALSGAHTIGVAHCGAFSNRLYNFTGKGDTDPSLDPVYAAKLKQQCPNPASPTIVVGMDPVSPGSFDTSYFQILRQNKGLFQSDAALLTDPGSADLVNRFQFRFNFLSAFGNSMVKMGNIEVLTGAAGEVRKNCRVVNVN